MNYSPYNLFDCDKFSDFIVLCHSTTGHQFIILFSLVDAYVDKLNNKILETCEIHAEMDVFIITGTKGAVNIVAELKILVALKILLSLVY